MVLGNALMYLRYSPVIDGPHGTRRMKSTPQLLQRSLTILELLFRLFTCDAVSFWHLAGEYVALSSKDVHIVVGEFAPPFPDRSYDLLPVPYDLMAVHDWFLFS